MRRRHSPLPKAWLFTDERLGGLHPDDPLWRALYRLPRGSGIVFRHHSLPPNSRRALALAIARVARARRLLLVLADPPSRVPHAGVHNCRPKSPQPRLLRTASAHNARELHATYRARADLVFLSPVFATRSHPGAPTLGPVRFGLLANAARMPVIALGGMDPQKARRLHPLGAHGYAAIDSWVRNLGTKAP